VSHIGGRDTAIPERRASPRGDRKPRRDFSDAVVARRLARMGGLAGGPAYKAINTADSMIGHRTPRHATLVSRRAGSTICPICGLAIGPRCDRPAAAISDATSASAAWRAVRRDARHHRSPNAGYPEAAMAGALGLSLAGPRLYGGGWSMMPRWAMGRAMPNPSDIRAALAL